MCLDIPPIDIWETVRVFGHTSYWYLGHCLCVWTYLLLISGTLPVCLNIPPIDIWETACVFGHTSY